MNQELKIPNKNLLYSDMLVDISDNFIKVKGFVLGDKTFEFSSIKEIRATKATWWNGKGRLIGTNDLRTWFPYDERSKRNTIFVIIFKKRWKRIGFTVTNSKSVKDVLHEKGLLEII